MNVTKWIKEYNQLPLEEKKNQLNWNSQAFLDHFNQTKKSAGYEERKYLLNSVFEHTQKVALAGEYWTENGNYVQLPLNPATLNNSKMYATPIFITNSEKNYQTEIQVLEMDSLEAAKLLQEKSQGPVAVLNIAHPNGPGGGVDEAGGPNDELEKRSQEASLFRRTNYFLDLYRYSPYHAWTYHLPLKRDVYPPTPYCGGFFSKDITVFRGPEEEGYPLLEQPFSMSFIAVGAFADKELRYGLNVRSEFPDLKAKSVAQAKVRMRTILNIALDNQITSLVLGAWGCGAFGNSPETISQLFHEVLEEETYKNRFEYIWFAILGQKNYWPFLKEFQGD